MTAHQQNQSASNTTTILWLLVAYHNLHEVDRYIDHLDSLAGSGTRNQYAICDNSSSHVGSRHAHRNNVVVTLRPDNPGYLDGALSALRRAADQDWSEADWIGLSNTDLTWRSGDPGRHLTKYSSTDPRVIAPRITEGSSNIDKNPHVLRRRPYARLALNRAATFTTTSTLIYQIAALSRIKLSTVSSSSRSNPRRWSERFPSGTSFYSPYGAVMFFSRSFAPDRNLPSGVPLLAEEYFIAESAASLDAPVTYVPELSVHHDPHTTTGPKITRRRAKGTRRAFKSIFNHASSLRRSEHSA